MILGGESPDWHHAPEFSLPSPSRQHAAAADVWSYGAIMVELITGQQQDVFGNVGEQRRRRPWQHVLAAVSQRVPISDADAAAGFSVESIRKDAAAARARAGAGAQARIPLADVHLDDARRGLQDLWDQVRQSCLLWNRACRLGAEALVSWSG